MNKRIRNKKIKDRYEYGINFLTRYCELSREIVEKEVKDDLLYEASLPILNKGVTDELTPYLDSVSIGLMMKYRTVLYKENPRETAYDFTFNGKDKDYDEEYKDYID